MGGFFYICVECLLFGRMFTDNKRSGRAAMKHRKGIGKIRNKGWRNKGDITRDQVRGMAKRLGIPFSDAAPGKHKFVEKGRNKSLEQQPEEGKNEALEL